MNTSLEFQKTLSQNKNQNPQDLDFKFWKTNIEIRVNIFDKLCVYVYVCVCQFSGKKNSFDFFSPDLPKNGFRVGNSENESASLLYHMCQFSVKIDNFEFFSPNLPNNGFRVGN